MKRRRTIFTGLSFGLFFALALVAGTVAQAQQGTDPRVADLVRAGKVRVALFLPQYSKDTVTGDLTGEPVEIARAFAARLGIEFQAVEHPTPIKAVECVKDGACDIAFLGLEHRGWAEVDFSPPYIEIDFTMLVPAGSSIRTIADADQSGVRIAVVRNHAATLTLSRMVKRAELVTTEIPDAAFDLLRTGHADAWALVRPQLLD